METFSRLLDFAGDAITPFPTLSQIFHGCNAFSPNSSAFPTIS